MRYYSVYPNPFSKELNVTIFSNSNCSNTIQLFNLLGEQVFQEKVVLGLGNNNFTLSLNNISNQIYFLRLTDDKLSTTIKLTGNNQ